MTPRFQDGIGVSGSRNGILDPDFCDYAPTSHRPCCTLEKPHSETNLQSAALLMRKRRQRDNHLTVRLKSTTSKEQKTPTIPSPWQNLNYT